MDVGGLEGGINSGEVGADAGIVVQAPDLCLGWEGKGYQHQQGGDMFDGRSNARVHTVKFLDHKNICRQRWFLSPKNRRFWGNGKIMEKRDSGCNVYAFICTMRLTFTIIFLLSGLWAVAQEVLNKDSLLRLLASAREDSLKVVLYVDIGQQYETNEPEKAKQYYRQAKVLSEKINWPRGVVKYATNYTFVLNMQGLYDSGLAINLQSVKLARKIGDPVILAKTLFNTGTSYRLMGSYENATAYYEDGKKIFAQVGNQHMEAVVDDILQTLCTELRQYEKGMEYGERAVALSRKENNPIWLSFALTNLGNNYKSLRKYDKALQLYEEALEISHRTEDRNMECSEYLNIGDIYTEWMEYEKVRPLAEKALSLSREMDLPESELLASKTLSLYYLYSRDYAKAVEYGQAALRLSQQHHLDVQRQKVLGHLAFVAYAMQDMRSGASYDAASNALGDSIMNETIQKHTLELEKKYESEKKEGLIRQLEKDKQLQQLTIRQKNTLNYILIGGAVMLLMVSLLSYRNYRQKQWLQQRRIQELETEKRLEATEAVLKGEEQERARLAKDLHDGLGGMLSGIKYSFNTMKGNLIMTPESQQAFDRSIDMLDSSIKEMRRVAHNMMPEALVKFGLDTALKDYCNDINQSGALKVSYQSYGLEGSETDQTQAPAITIYRIVQELINNVLKHAAARTVLVQVTRAEATISVTVEDDGKGFDPAILDRAQGIGWSNIRNRVEFLKGKLDIRSAPDKGTSVHIEINNI